MRYPHSHKQGCVAARGREEGRKNVKQLCVAKKMYYF